MVFQLFNFNPVFYHKPYQEGPIINRTAITNLSGTVNPEVPFFNANLSDLVQVSPA